MSFSLRFLKNKSIIKKECAVYIHHYQCDSPGILCDEVMLRHIERYMDENKDLISAQRNTDADFKIFVKKLISKVSDEQQHILDWK